MADEKLGWFTTKGRLGDRLLKQQLVGLDPLFDYIKGRDRPLTVLDVGCAEGLITMKCFDAGAVACHGVEIVLPHVNVANKLRGDRACTFEVGDVNEWQPQRQYDIVLLLAILHKLKDPLEACRRFADAARSLVVIRLPPGGSVIRDERTNFHPFDVGTTMEEAGFVLGENGPIGPFGEWMGYYERRAMGTIEDYRADKAAGNKWRFKSYEAVDIGAAPPGHIMFDDGVRDPL